VKRLESTDISVAERVDPRCGPDKFAPILIG